MKNTPRLRLYASLLALAALISPLSAAEPVPLLENGDFEQGRTGWKLIAATSTSAVIGEGGARSGKLGLTITDNSDTAFARAEGHALPSAPGRTYKLTFWARTHSPGTYGGISVRFLTADGKIAGDPMAMHAQAVDTGGEWEAFALTATAPEGTATVTILIHTYSRQEGVVDFDDVDFSEIGGSAQTSAGAPAAARPAEPVVRGGAKGLYIVIKADDLVVQNGAVPPRWEKFAAYLRERGIKSGIGIITHSLVADSPAYFDWIKEHHAGGIIEFWFHGHTHRHWKDNGADRYEFKGPSLEEQRDHFVLGQRLAREKLGFAFRSFAAPYNAIDENTARALADDPDLTIWMYGDKALLPPGKILLDRDYGVNIENPVMVPSLAKFARGYAATSAKRRYYVIQAHPQQWDDERFAEFTRIIDFLVEHEARFVTPLELVAALKL